MDKEQATTNLKLAEKGAILSIAAYIVLAFVKLIGGYFAHSSALVADGFNNFTDVISSVAVWIGLRLSQKPVDEDHPYGHWKFEMVASFMTSFIMFFVGIEVFKSSVQALFNGEVSQPSAVSSLIAFGSGCVMIFVYWYNKKLAKQLHSLGLEAAAKDNFSDAMVSFTTAVAVLSATLGLRWLDTVMAITVGVLIIKTAVDIFRESTFALTDGFDQSEIESYKPYILSQPHVRAIREIKARRYGANIYLDLTVLMDATMTVLESHEITEKIEEALYQECSISFIDIHVEPYVEDSVT